MGYKKYCEDVSSMPLSEAVKEIDDKGAFVIAGSLYMAGEYKALTK